MHGHYQCWDGIICLCTLICLGWYNEIDAYDHDVVSSLDSACL